MKGNVKYLLKHLITLVGALIGAAAGFGIALLISLLAETIIQPQYPDLIMGWFYWPLLVCVPLFSIGFSILFHRLSSRLLRLGHKRQDSDIRR